MNPATDGMMSSEVFAALVLVPVVGSLVAGVWLTVRAIRRRQAWIAANFWICWVVLAVVLGLLLASGQTALALTALGNLAVLGPIGLGWWWFRRRGSLHGTIRRIEAGDRDGALADLRARVDRQRAALGLAAVGADDGADSTPAPGPATPAGDFNPYAAPASGGATVGERLRLAHDLNTLGVIESNRGDWAAALVAYDEALALVEAGGGIVPVIQGNRGYALIELGRSNEGLPLLRAAIADLDPSDRWVRAQFLTALADKLLALGQTAEVGALIDRAHREGRRERVYPRAGRRAWLARLDNLRTRLATAEVGRTLAPHDPAETAG